MRRARKVVFHAVGLFRQLSRIVHMPDPVILRVLLRVASLGDHEGRSGQCSKALSPISVTLDETTTYSNQGQELNANLGMLFTLFGTVTPINPEFLWNAARPIVFTLSGMTTFVTLSP